MKQSITGVLVLASLAVSAHSLPSVFKVFEDHQINFNNATADDFNYYVHGMQGFWSGYMQGLYNTDKPHHLTEACLSKDISQKFASLAFELNSGNFLLLPEIFSNLMTVVANFDECGLEKSIEEVAKYCSRTHDCEPESIFGGLAGKAFQLIEKFTAVADILREFPADSADEVYEQGITIGKSLGSTLRIIFNFQHKK